MKWPSLRPIQTRAIKAYLQTNQHLVLMAETAAGKTEAAFLPILSSLVHEPTGSVRVIYVGPLKALINDQFSRLEELCKHIEMPVHRWHGDVSASQKKDLVKNPSGVLLITPESLESLLVNKTSQLSTMFGGLRAIVIDEIHAFLEGERGLHLASLLTRIQRYQCENQPPVRLLGLSATIGDPNAARIYLSRDNPNSVSIILDESDCSEVLIRVHGYDAADLSELIEQDDESSDEPTADSAVMSAIAEDLVEHCRTHSNLIFANRKSDIELYADFANQCCRQSGLLESFLVHHGSLSKELREDTEDRMKMSKAKTTICSSTLEMGIDIGSVRMVGQIGAPWSVASLKQRMGRSGRSSVDPRRLRCYIDVTTIPTPGNPISFLPLELLQTIATCELMIEGWTEPPRTDVLDLSTLTHQVISTIAETGAIFADQLCQRLCVEGPFGLVSIELFARVLRSLGSCDVIEQGPDGALILGLLGEKLRSSQDFYAAFASKSEYTVVHGNHALGTLPLDALPKPGEFIVFAARRWQILSLETERRMIHVKPSKRRNAPKFVGSGGVIHHRIRNGMLQLLKSSKEIVYLNESAQNAFEHARRYASDHNLCNREVISLGNKRCLWLTWTGTQENRTFQALLRSCSIYSDDEQVGIVCHCSSTDLREILRHWSTHSPQFHSLAEHIVPKQCRKYDEFLTDELLDESIASELIWTPLNKK
tara:strand:- start:2744 stop:4870 length:2127 start_codon:yes stop_codon:yes gene_type:complete